MNKLTPYTLGIYTEVTNNQFSQFKADFATRNQVQNFPAHLTLFSMPVPEEKIEPIRQEVKKIIEGLKPFRLLPLKLVIEPSTGFTYVEFSNNKVNQLHYLFLKQLSKYRNDTIREKDEAISSDKFVQKYGFKFTAENYIPHLTLGKMNDSAKEQDLLYTSFLKFKNRAIIADSINAGVYLDRIDEKKSIWEDKYLLKK